MFDQELTIERIKKLLPHGSGINGNWNVERSKKHSNIFYASNTYDAMRENGMYCHYYDFTLTIQYNGADKHTPCKHCAELGVDHNLKICFVCSGMGYTFLSEYEILRLNFHSQREYACCGYGLRDYIFETCMIA